MHRIEVDDCRAGVLVIDALVGDCLELFEIRLDSGIPTYWVRQVAVTPEVYRDALSTAAVNSCCPLTLEPSKPQPTAEPS